MTRACRALSLTEPSKYMLALARDCSTVPTLAPLFQGDPTITAYFSSSFTLPASVLPLLIQPRLSRQVNPFHTS